jgi:ATP/maltotriose-dependent transcriptional regulator MalT
MALDRGDHQGAADLVERHLRRLPVANRTERAAALELLVRAETRRERLHDFDRARAALEELRDIAASAGTLPLLASASLAAGLIALAEGDAGRARRELEDAVDRFDQSGAPFEAACARIDLASVMERLGRSDAALAELDRAIAELTRLDARLGMSSAKAVRERLSPRSASPSFTSKDAGGLTARELEVLRLISNGLSNLEIAERLCISEHTVHRHVANTLSKLDVSSRSAAVAHVAKLGLL